MGDNNPTGRISLTEKVRGALAERISSESLQPGDRLPSEREMIAEFGVSRTVVRDAISRLREQGLVETRQGAGAFVRSGLLPPSRSDSVATFSDIVETIEVRAAIEIEAARLAAARGSPSQHAEICEKWEEMRLATTDEDAEAADLQFHLAIAAATNNSRFAEFFDFLGQRSIPRSHLRLQDLGIKLPPRLNDALLEEHRAILNAILNNDPHAAGESMRCHLRAAQQRYVALIRARSS